MCNKGNFIYNRVLICAKNVLILARLPHVSLSYHNTFSCFADIFCPKRLAKLSLRTIRAGDLSLSLSLSLSLDYQTYPSLSAAQAPCQKLQSSYRSQKNIMVDVVIWSLYIRSHCGTFWCRYPTLLKEPERVAVLSNPRST